MNAAKQALWFFLLLLSLAGSGWYFASSPSIFKLDTKTLSTTPDTFITNLIVQQFDATGKLLHYLHTPLLQHTPINNEHQLTKPHIIVTQLNQPPWTINAHHATALYGGKQITFNQHVIINQKKGITNQETTLLTEEITYFPHEKLATTIKDVTLIQDGNTVQSTGMKAYLAENRVQLLSNARGVYASNAK